MQNCISLLACPEVCRWTIYVYSHMTVMQLQHFDYYLFIYQQVCFDCKLVVQDAGACTDFFFCMCLSVCQECAGANGYVSACVNCTTCS